MSWKGGHIIFDSIIESLNNNDIDDETRKLIYTELIPVFEEEDCDTLEECLGQDIIFDKVLKEHKEESKEDEWEKEEWEDYE